MGGIFHKEKIVKKVYGFLRSMRFGIILLVLIAACSAVGSLIQQGQDISWYAQNYTEYHGIMLKLQLNDIYHSWYFVVLMALLCLNLILCSIVRIVNVVNAKKADSSRALYAKNEVGLNPEGIDTIKQYFETMHCKYSVNGQNHIYSKNGIGRYGTFITHLAILLTVVFGAAALYLPTTVDRTCYPKESITMNDGTEIYVDSFSIEDETGKLDYKSYIKVSLPNGKVSELEEIYVNHPFQFGPYKIYQQTYGTAGSVTVKDLQTGATDDFMLSDICFLSVDGTNGVWFEALYPGYVKDENGDMTIITNTSGSYADPVYQVQVASDGVFTPVLVFPGESLTVEDLEFTFNAPIEYPGLRIKHTPTIVNALLCAVFVLMIVGLYISFFMQPILVKVDEEGYAVLGPKSEKLRLDLKILLEDYIKENEE